MPNEITADQFYRLRDERTGTLVAEGALRGAKLVLSIDEREAETLAGQLGFLVLVSLNARWCRDIVLQAPNSKVHPGLSGIGKGSLPDLALDMASGADPFGSFTLAAPGRDMLVAGSVGVHVGSEGQSGSYPVMGRGWMAESGPHLRLEPITGEEQNPLGSVLAACVGTCHAMRRVLGLSPVFQDVRLSLWNMADGEDAAGGPALESASLGNVLLVGAGAIGAGIAYLIPLIRPKISRLVTVDRDGVDYPNLNRVPLFQAADVGSLKVDVVRSYLKRWGIEAEGICKWFDDAALSLGQFDLLIPAANERGAREAIMSNIPPLMISGSTGSQWDAYQQRHIPLVDDCLSCRFPPTPQAARLACSTGTLSLPEPGVPKETGALPFLSLTGAVMAVSEIAKLAYGHYPDHGNYATLWFNGEQLRFMTATKAKRSGCSYCVEPGIFRKLNGEGLFGPLSLR